MEEESGEVGHRAGWVEDSRAREEGSDVENLGTAGRQDIVAFFLS